MARLFWQPPLKVRNLKIFTLNFVGRKVDGLRDFIAAGSSLIGKFGPYFAENLAAHI